MKNKLRFVHLADAHLGMSFKHASFGKSFGDKKRQGIFDHFVRVIDYIKENDLDLLLISGDFIEGDLLDYPLLENINYLFSKIPQTTIILQAGNHDPLSVYIEEFKSIPWCENLIFMMDDYDTIDIDALGLSINGLSWKNKGPMYLDRQGLVKSINDSKYNRRILMLHGDLYTEGAYLSLDKDFLLDLPVDYVALGHIHKQAIIDDKLAYPGSLEALDFSEDYGHGFLLVTLDMEEASLDIHVIDQATYPIKVINLELDQARSSLEILDLLEKVLNEYSLKKHDMVRILLSGTRYYEYSFNMDQVKDRILEQLKGRVAYAEVKDRTKEGYDLDLLKKEHSRDLIGYFIKDMEEKGLDKPLNARALKTGLRMLLEAMER